MPNEHVNPVTTHRAIQARAQAAPWHAAVEILVTARDADGIRQAVATNLTFETITDGAMIEPTLRLNYEAAQTLMDDLWQAGLRPTEGTGSAGALKATERHLEDMRKIAFKLMGTSTQP